MKIDLETIHAVLTEEGVEPTTRQEVIKKLEKMAEDEKESGAKGKKTKYQYVAVVTQEQHELPVKDAAIYLVKVPADADHNKVEDTVRIAAVKFNQSKKGKKCPMKKISDFFYSIKTKFLKNEENDERAFGAKEFKVQTKEPVIVVAVPQEIIK